MIVYSADVRKKYNELINDIANASVWDVLDGGKDSRKAELNNDTPDYNNTEVLQINVWSKPKGNVYLKGYYAEYYNDGVWENDYKRFEEACRNAGQDPFSVSQNVVNMPVERVLEQAKVKGLDNHTFGYETEITYIEDSGKKAYVPYFSQIGEGSDVSDVTIEGDGRYRKDKNMSSMSLFIWAYGGKYQDNMFLFPEGKNEPWQEWYEKYVLETYLDVPEYMTNVKEVAKELKTWKEYLQDSTLFENDRRRNYRPVL